MDDDKKYDLTLQRTGRRLQKAKQEWRERIPEDAFVVILTGKLKGSKMILVSHCTTMGRAVSCNIQLSDRMVSGSHAEIIRRNDTYTIRDLDSSNGTFVNGSKVKGGGRELTNGDRITIGITEMIFTDPKQPHGT